MSTPPETTPLPPASRVPYLRPIGAVALAIGMVWSTSIAAGNWREVRANREKHTIRVTGSAKKRIVSDLIQWEACIEARAPERTAAYQTLREGRDKAVAFLLAQGIKAEEIQPQSTTVEEIFEKEIEDKVLPGTTVAVRSEKSVSKGFLTRESIVVRSTDVARVEKASREITSLLEQGVSVNSENPRYFYTPLGELKLEMLAAAAKDAHSRAENILRSAGNATMGKLIVADMGIININPANATKTSEEGNNDTTSLDKDIITIVHAEFEVE
ncbi:MAG: SIMPL domain-containing protein [Chthoniobacter sp.]|uniref:SIMPL domain-containing protein n=1 Tax=Chthoniobacter sp. TaxID=2510640 RepID=UPI0032A3D62C